MRFTASQTTPRLSLRRLQLKLLLFVGFVTAISFMFCTMNDRTGLETTNPATLASGTNEEQSIEVRREPLDANVINPAVPDVSGIRGQSPRTAARPRTTAVESDRDLFEPRSKERLRTGNTRSPLFTRNSAANDDGELLVEPEDSNPIANDSNPFQGDRTDDRPVRSRPSTRQPVNAPDLNDDWSAPNTPSQPDFSPSNIEPRRDRRTPASQPMLPGTNFIDTPNGDPVDDFRDRQSPADTPDPQDNFSDRDRDFTPSPRRGTFDDFNDNTDNTPTALPSRSNPHKRRDNSFDNSTDNNFDDNVPRTTNPGQRDRDLFLPPSPDNQPQYDDLDSVQIDKRFLDVVKDNTMGIRRDESDVFYWLVDHARRVPTKLLEREGEREVQYINLMSEPDRFRGEPITIEGDLWRLYEYEASRNRYGVTQLYEAWVFTGDSSNHPYRIVCTSLPRGIVPGENLRKPVRITGYFFKREGYRSNGGVHIAPTLIARRIAINPMPNGFPYAAGIVPYAMGAIVAIGLALLVTIVSVAVSDERSQRSSLERRLGFASISFSNIAITPPITIEESLRQLAEHDRESEIIGAYGPLFSRKAALEHARLNNVSTQTIVNDGNNRKYRRQTSVVNTWAKRQQANQAEVEAMHESVAAREHIHPQSTATVSPPLQMNSTAVDELDASRLDPAWNVLPPLANHEEQYRSNEQSPSRTIENFVNRQAQVSHPVPSSKPFHQPVSTSIKSNGPTSTNHISTPIVPTSIDYSASKISEWEDEIAKLTHHDSIERHLPTPAATSREDLIAAQIERDRIDRERDTQHRIERERADHEQHQSARHEHDRHDHDSNQHASHRHPTDEPYSHLHNEHQTFDRVDRDRATFTLPSESHSPTNELYDADEFEITPSGDDYPDADESTSYDSEASSNDSSNTQNPSSSNWNRSRKRRRGRDGRSR